MAFSSVRVLVTKKYRLMKINRVYPQLCRSNFTLDNNK